MQASWQQSAWATAQATPRGEEGLQYAQPQDPTVSYEGSVSMDQLRYQKGEVNLPNAPVAEGPIAGVDHHNLPLKHHHAIMSVTRIHDQPKAIYLEILEPFP